MAHTLNQADIELAERVKRDYDFILFTIVDLNGIPRTKMFASRHVEMMLENEFLCPNMMVSFGPRNEVVEIPRCLDDNYGNCRMIADGSSLHSLPWMGQNKKARFCEIFAEMAWMDDTPMEMIPRYVAKRQLEELDKMGLKLFSTGEYEFRVFKEDGVTPGHDGTDMYLPSHIFDFNDFVVDLQRYLFDAGVNIEFIHPEFGSGMWESPVRPEWGILAADNMVILKEGVRQIAKLHGLRATFMTKPLANENADGCHFNHSVWTKDGKNAFYDPSKPDKLSELCRHWIGGVMKHARALLALCSPTVTCYRRLHHTRVPSEINWNIDDRFCMLRVKNSSESGCYIENRLGTAAANPYLIFAGTLAAGLDGVRNKIEPPPPKSDDLGKLPYSLDEALAALEQDTELGKALGSDFVDWFVRIKRDADLTSLKGVDISQDRAEDYARERAEYFDYI